MRAFDVNALTALIKGGEYDIYVLHPKGNVFTIPGVTLLESDVPSKYSSPQFQIKTSKIFKDIIKYDEFHQFDRIIYNLLLSINIPESISSRFLYICHGNFPVWGRTRRGIEAQRFLRNLRVKGGKSYIVGSDVILNKYIEYGKTKAHIGNYDPSIDPFDGCFDINVVDHTLDDIIKRGSFPERTQDFVFVGRACNQKNIKLALKLKSLGFDIKIFTVEDPHNKEYLKDKQLSKCIVGASREEIFENLLRSKYYLFPSKYEASGGISSFEAASSGCKVIHTIPEPLYYLEGYGASVMVDNLTIDDYSRELDFRLNIEYSTSQALKQIEAYAKNYTIENLYNRLRNILSWH